MYLQKFRKITTFVLDVDGVLTDGNVLVTEEGHQLRGFNIKDGYALQHAIKKGFHVIIISGGDSRGVAMRLQKLGVTEVHIAVQNKRLILIEVLNRLSIDLENCLMMGDDVPDKELLQMVGCATCPADAVPEIRFHVDYVSPFNGGKGCVRDVIEQVMRLAEAW